MNDLQSAATNHNQLQASQLDYILLDGSGSMQPKWWDMIGAIEVYIDGLKQSNVNSHLIISTFATEDHDLRQRDCKLADCKPFSEEPLLAHFTGTPLFDAINKMARNLRDDDPACAAILIVTDGAENGSRYTTLPQAKALLDWCRAKGWQVIFMGCDFNNSEQARLLGANEDNAIGVSKRLLSDAASLLAKKRAAHYHGADDIHFSKSEQQQFGGLLPAPPRNTA